MKRKSYPDDLTDQEWEQIQDLATEQLNPKGLGRNVYASAGIIDSQSVKTTEKGGLKVMTEVKRSMVGKDIFW